MSLYFPETNSLLLHVPKTAGHFARTSVRKLGVKYREARSFSDNWHPPFWDIDEDVQWSAAFVCHPLAWYESFWRSQAGQWRDCTKYNWVPMAEIQAYANDDFCAWLDAVTTNCPGFVTRMFESYCGPPTWPSGVAKAPNFVGKRERLCTDLAFVLTQCTGSDVRADRLRRMKPANVSCAPRPAWTRRLKHRVITTELPAITRWY